MNRRDGIQLEKIVKHGPRTWALQNALYLPVPVHWFLDLRGHHGPKLVRKFVHHDHEDEE